ncbi:aldo/keto reductase [Emticicia sp. SJ17W-69]|uniref:aldo/keto reductase n=1 Tax=Emticicia sp. SJ17W-69 TaxID=3421657 RepID=UPI003EC0E671
MNYRKLGKTGFEISEISLGTWQVGGKWGDDFSHLTAEKILNAAVDSGINFIDTADVYGDGESEKAVGRFVKSRSERIFVATKCGRQLNPHVNEAYQPSVLRKFVENSLKNMGLETLDLIQLHCPPTEVYYRPEIFELFDRLKEEGKVLNLGISVEKVEEALKGIEYNNVTSVQIIFNMFRQRPAELFFEQAQKKNVGIIVRVPLASGLLTGKFSKQSTFTAGDHRNFNRNGEMFDKGETFSGIDYETGLSAVEELKKLFPQNDNLAPIALRWILQHEAVSTIIPGASRPEQVTANLESLSFPDLSEDQLVKIDSIYKTYIKKSVHQLW